MADRKYFFLRLLAQGERLCRGLMTQENELWLSDNEEFSRRLAQLWRRGAEDRCLY